MALPAIDQTNIAIDVAVLKEQMVNVNATLRRLEEINASQSNKLSALLEQKSHMDGGWRAVMWLGGAFGALSAVVVGWLQYFASGKHP